MTGTPARTDVWSRLRAATDARIGLGRSGAGLPTAAMLDLQIADALARDAVHTPLASETIVAALTGLEIIEVESQAEDRRNYLSRPDLGRRLAPVSRDHLPPGPCDLAMVLADGLSPGAVAANGPVVVRELLARSRGRRPGPIVIARQARVALGDEIGALLGATIVVVLIGERPGLSAADSLGAYITWRPEVGRLDSERNCISNIRPGGLSASDAAARIVWLLNAARERRLTGVELKEAQAIPLALE